jgi:hypothetical protein
VDPFYGRYFVLKRDVQERTGNGQCLAPHNAGLIGAQRAYRWWTTHRRPDFVHPSKSQALLERPEGEVFPTKLTAPLKPCVSAEAGGRPLPNQRITSMSLLPDIDPEVIAVVGLKAAQVYAV